MGSPKIRNETPRPKTMASVAPRKIK